MTQYAPRLVRLPIPAAIARSFAVVSLLLPGLALAGPTGGVVVGGQATIGNPSPTSTVIHQGSNSAIINWQQFNIGGNEYVQFIQPSSSSVVLNRVIGGSPSEIFGSLSANGRVFLINPNGVLFAPGAQLDVGGLVASTMNIKDADFLSGHYVFAGGSAPGSSVVNGGTIKTGNGGFVVLAGDYVKNTGIIQAKLGQVVLASGSATTLELGNSGLVSFAVDKATLAQKAGVDNAGQIIADGGRVIMTAKTAHDLVGSAVNNTGLVRAQGIASHNGEIELTASGGDITDSGTLDASNASGPGGTVTIAGDRDIEIQKDAQILASGTSGGKVSIVATGTLNTRAGSLIDTHGAGGQGGHVELSGHDKLIVRGDITPGSGGTLLIDPTNLTIANGSGSSSSATVFENVIEAQLQNNVDVQLIASNSITLANLSDGTLNGVNPAAGGYGGSLLLGIGTINPADASYVEGNSGSILFANKANTIDVYGGLRIDAGSTGGTVQIGNLIGGDVDVKGLGGISAGNITATRGSISLDANTGNIVGGNLAATGGTITVDATGSGITLGNLSATFIGSYGDASISVQSAAGIEVGSVTTDAESAIPFGSAAGNVTLNANFYAENGGDLLVNGAISATAKGGNASSNTATLTLGNSAGSITALNGLTTDAVSGAVHISGQGGNINIGAITATNSSISVNTSFGSAGTGNISLGTLSGGGAPGDALSSVSIGAYGGITVNSDITATSIGLFTNNGDLKAGNITVLGQSFSVTEYGGDLTLGNVSASNSISLSDVGGGSIKAGNLTSLNGSISASTDNNGNISLGSLSGGGGTNQLTFVDLNASGTLTIANTGIVAANIALSAGSGLLSTGDLTSTAGHIAVTNSGGNVQTGNISTNDSNSAGADATVVIYAAGGISTGSISTNAKGSGSAVSAYIALEANSKRYATQLGGDLNVGGPISTSAATSSSTGTASGVVSMINTDGSISVGNGAAGSGNITASASGGVGNGQKYIELQTSQGSITTGDLSAGNGISLAADSDLISTGNLTTGNGNIAVTNSGGSITLGDLSTTDVNNTTAGANATVTVYAAGGITTGSITTHAQAAASSAAAYVDLEANSERFSTALGGNLVVGGAISTSAVNLDSAGSARGYVSLSNGKGAIDTGSHLITTSASTPGTNFAADIQLQATDGDITSGNLTVIEGGAISVSTTGSGNIDIGQLSAAGAGLGIVVLNSAGGLTTNGTAITAQGLGLSAANGNLSTGDLTVSGAGLNVADYGGTMTLGNVHVNGGISLFDSNGGITTGNLSSADNIFITTIGSGGNVSIGTLTANSGTLGTLDIESSGGIDIGGPGHAATTSGVMTLRAGNGDVTTGDLTGTFSSVTVSSANGNITLGKVTADGPISITSFGASNDINDTTVTNGNINTGDLTDLSGDGITVTSTDFGSITVGKVSGSVNGSLGSVKLTAADALNVGGTDITAASIVLAAGNGDLTAGNLNSTGSDTALLVTDSNGKITLGNVTAEGDITLTDSNGGISAGNLAANQSGAAITVSSTGAGANIQLGALSGGSTDTPLSLVSVVSGGTLSTGSSINAGSIILTASAGDLSLNTLTAGAGGISITDNGGNVILNGGDSTSNAGIINVGASGNITFTNNINADGALTFNAGGTISANGAGNALSAGGIANITGGSLALYNISGSGITLSATGGDADFNTATASAGSLEVDDIGGAINGGRLSAVISTTVPGSGSVVVKGDQGMNLGGINAGTAFTVTNNSGTVTLGNTVAGSIDVTNNNGNVVLNGGDSTTGSGSLSVSTPHGSITYTNNITAGGLLDFTASGLISANGAGNSLTAGTTATLSGSSLALFNVTGTTVTLTATAGNIGFNVLTASTGPLDVGDSGGTIVGNALTSTHGAITLAGDQGINVGSSSASTAFTVTNNSGDITLSNTIAGSIGITNSNGNVVLNGGDSTAAGGAISVSTPKGSITYTNNITAGGLLDFTASGLISANGAGNSLTAGTTATLSGSSLALFNVTGGTDITLLATAGDLDANSLRVGSGSITADTTAGNISISNLGASGQGTLDAVTVTSSGILDIGGGGLSATTITLGAGANLNLGSLSAGAGGITITDSAGNITFGSVATTGNGGAIKATASAGNILYTNNISADGALSFTASGAISANGAGNSLAAGTTVTLDGGNLALFNVTGGSGITLNASKGDLVANSLLVINGAITADTTAGNISINSLSASADGTLSKVEATASGSLSIGGNGFSADTIVLGAGANLNLGTLNAGAGGITVTDTAGNIVFGSTATTSNGGAIKATASAGNILYTNNISADGALGFTASGTISANGSGNSLTAGDGVILAGGNLALFNVSGSSITLSASSGDLDANNLFATNGAITANASVGNINVGTLSGGSSGLAGVTLSAGGTLSSTTTDITAGSIALVAGAGTLSFGALTASSGSLVIGNTGGAVHTGNLTANHGKLTLVSNGTLTVGNVSASSVEAVSSGGNALYGDLTSSGVIDITTGGGNLKIGNVTANQFFTNVDTGNEQVGNVDITGTNFFFSLGDISGQTLNIGNLSFAAPGNITFGYDNASLSIGNVSVGGGLSVVLGNGNLSAGNIVAGTGAISLSGTHGAITAGNLTASSGAVTVADGSGVNLGKVLAGGNIQISAGSGAISAGDLTANGGSSGINVLASGSGGDIALGNLTASGDITLSAAHGALTFGNLGGTNIALSTGQALTISGRSINAAGSFTLAAGGNTSIANSSIDAGSASLTSSGSLEIANSSVIAQTVTLNASGAIAISGNSLIGTTAQGNLTGGLQPRDTATSSVSLTSGADISIDQSTLRTVQLALNGKGIHLANGAVLNGTNVVITGTGAVDAAGSSSSIDAGALSVRGGSIDLTDAVLTVGSGSATFGADSSLLARIHAKDPTLVLPTAGPNASFAAAGGVKLGKLSIAGGYLFIEAPTLQLPTALSGNANMFVDFLPTDPAALLNVDLTQPLPGIATLVFGGTPQTGNIQVGDGTQTFALTSKTNLVFATSGATLYPDSISSNGAVVVLGDSVLRTPPVDLTDIPLTTDQYTVDAPDTGVLAYSGDQGDINDPGVNDANKGRIDIKTSSQQTLSCGIGGGL